MDQEPTIESTPANAGYTPRQRWVIIASVAVLAMIGGSIAFASGVYVGNNRELAPGARPSFPGGPPPQNAGGQPGQGAPQGIQGGQQAVPGAQGGLPQGQGQGGVQQPVNFALTGGFVARDGSMLVLAAPGGELRVAIDAGTRYVRDGQPVNPSQIQQGAQVGVRYRQGVAIADVVQVLTARPPQQTQPRN